MSIKPIQEQHQAVSDTHPQWIFLHLKCFDDTLYSQPSVTFVKEYNDDHVAQIFIDTLENNNKDICKSLSSQKV